MSMAEKMWACLDGRVEALRFVALLALMLIVGLFALSAFAVVPTDITLSPSKVMDTADTSAGTLICSLSTGDADGGTPSPAA